VVLRASGGRVVYDEGEPNQVEAVRNVSLELRRGEVLALVGPSGCGKTTLFNAIAGLIPLQGGRIEVSGKQVDKATGHVGYMLQKDLLLPWRTVLDNVTLGLEVRGTSAAKARAIAMDLIHRYGRADANTGFRSGGHPAR
jgi:NitT/TauT family transport system ATP-binding protein